MGFVSPLVSPARKLASHPPSLFSPFSRETVPAQSSTDFLTHTLRLYHKNRVPSKNASGRLNLRGRFSIPKLSFPIITKNKKSAASARFLRLARILHILFFQRKHR